MNRNRPRVIATESTKTLDSKYTVGRVSPKHITETLDRVEVMSTESAESTTEDRLRVLDAGPEGWEPGMPMPWSMRSPTYDKPLPLPSRTPSPLPEPSPVGRRERGSEGAGRDKSEPIRVLFPQDTESWERVDEQFFDVSDESPPLRNSPKTAFPSSPVSQGRVSKKQLSLNDLMRDEDDRQRLLQAFQQTSEQHRGPSPLGFAKSVSPSSLPPFTLMRALEPSPVDLQPQPAPKHISRASRPPKGDTSRSVSPLSFADLLYPSQARIVDGVQRKVSPRTQLIDLAEKGQSRQMLHELGEAKWEMRQSGEFFADDHIKEHSRMRRSLSGEKPRRRRTRGSVDDWRADRKYTVERFFAPSLFDETDNSEPHSRRGDKADWQVRRQYHVDRFFIFGLFNEGGKMTERAYRKGRKDDWKAVRQHPVDYYFTPYLFEERKTDAKTQGAAARKPAAAKAPAVSKKGAKGKRGKKGHHHHHRHHKKKTSLASRLFGVFKRFTPSPEPVEPEPRRGSARDWKVERAYPVDHFFIPALFDEMPALNKHKTTRKSREAKDKLKSRRGNKDDWKAERANFVDRLFEPGLFEQESKTRRGNKSDWMVRRSSHVDKFFDPRLFDESAPTRPVTSHKSMKAGRGSKEDWKTHRAELSGMSFELDQFGEPSCRKGRKDDWQVQRRHHPERYFVPALFDGQPQKKNVLRLPSSLFRDSPSGFSEEELERYQALPSGGDEQAVKHTASPFQSMVSTKKARKESPAKRQTGQEPNWMFWDTVISFGPLSVSHGAMLQEAFGTDGAGIPGELLNAVWLSLLGFPMVEALCQVYPDLLNSAEGSVDERIEYDVERATDDPEEQRVLASILMAYCAYDPVVGYAPGMLHIAMLLREQLGEEQSFAGLVRIYFAWDHRRLVVPGIEGLRESLYSFQVLLDDTLPELSQHLGKNGISCDLYASKWFHALHIDSSFDQVLMTWFLMDGIGAVYSAGLGLLALNEQRLLEAEDPEEITHILNHDIMAVADDEFVSSCLAKYRVSSEILSQLASDFAQLRARSLSEYAAEEYQLVQREAEKVLSSLARLSTRIQSILSDRLHLVERGVSGRSEVSDLHRLCYEQAYRLHTDDALLIAERFYSSIDEDLAKSPNESRKQATAVDTEAVVEELADVKVKYADALAKLDALKDEFAQSRGSERTRML